jgi:hypothetical protein
LIAYGSSSLGRPAASTPSSCAEPIRRSWVDNDRWTWDSATEDEPTDLYALWYGAAERSRTTWAKLGADDGLDVIVADEDPQWSQNRRRILFDLLEEYLKHTGHADVLREAVDGLRGNDPD